MRAWLGAGRHYFTLRGLGGVQVRSGGGSKWSPGETRKDGSVVGVEVATYSEFSEEKYIPKAIGANLGRQKRGLKAAWLATHVAFEVMVFTQFPEGGRGYGKSPSVYNRSVL